MDALERKFSPVIEQTPLAEIAGQRFFDEWCATNDSLWPTYLPRDKWEVQRGEGMIGDTKDRYGRRPLYLPADLHLWEMVDVVHAIDHDTFQHDPRRQSAQAQALVDLGERMAFAGIYIAQRLDSVKAGRELAEGVAEEFIDYGDALMSGKRPAGVVDISGFRNFKIPPEKMEETERWLAGDALYEKSQQRVEDAARVPAQEKLFAEMQRRKKLAQFFRVSEKALQLQSAPLKKTEGKTPMHHAFADTVAGKLERTVEAPKAELWNAVFRRGLQKMMDSFKHPASAEHTYGSFRDDAKKQIRELYGALNIDRLKSELQRVRQTDSDVGVAHKEFEIARVVQNFVSKLQYREGSYSPAKIVNEAYINCVGASMIGSQILEDIGIKTLVASTTTPAHSQLLLVTSSGSVYWFDMQSPSDNAVLWPSDISPVSGSKSITSDDIADFAKRPKPKGLAFLYHNSNISKRLSKADATYVSVQAREAGLRAQMSHWIGLTLAKNGENHAAKCAYDQGIKEDPNMPGLYNGIGNILVNEKDIEGAEAMYRRTVSLDPTNAAALESLAVVYRWHRHDNAASVDFYEQALARNPSSTDAYFHLASLQRLLGRDLEAVRSFQRYLELVKKEPDSETKRKQMHAASEFIEELINKTSDDER